MNLSNRGPIGQKPAKAKKNPARIQAVAGLPCVICGLWPVEVHHCISGRYGQRKASDDDTIPLCYDHHRGRNGIHTSKRAWEALHGMDTGYLATVNVMLR